MTSLGYGNDRLGADDDSVVACRAIADTHTRQSSLSSPVPPGPRANDRRLPSTPPGGEPAPKPETEPRRDPRWTLCPARVILPPAGVSGRVGGRRREVGRGATCSPVRARARAGGGRSDGGAPRRAGHRARQGLRRRAAARLRPDRVPGNERGRRLAAAGRRPRRGRLGRDPAPDRLLQLRRRGAGERLDRHPPPARRQPPRRVLRRVRRQPRVSRTAGPAAGCPTRPAPRREPPPTTGTTRHQAPRTTWPGTCGTSSPAGA